MRLIPFLFLCYLCCYLDRVNVGFAKLQMQDDLAFSNAVYGFGAGVFFIGYFFFELPSNLLILRYGARRCIARIMILWGLLSTATMFVSSPLEFYIVRFLLGAAEAGFFPGVIFYLTLWYPAQRRGKVIALFGTAVAVSTVVGAPVSGLIMENMNGYMELKGWQWLFLIEGLPSVAIGFLALRYLDDNINQATWLTDKEKTLVRKDLDSQGSAPEHSTIRAAFRLPETWLMSSIYFFLVMGLYGLNFWMPTIIQELGYEDLVINGVINMIPFGAAAVTMVLVGWNADRVNERYWHIVVPAFIGAIALFASIATQGNPILSIVALTVAACGIFSALPQTWGLVTTFVTGGAAAATIAIVNSIGNLAGFVGPFAIGLLKDMTGSTALGVGFLVTSLIIGALMVLVVARKNQ